MEEKKYHIFYHGEHFTDFNTREQERVLGVLSVNGNYNLLSEEEVIDFLKDFQEKRADFLDKFFNGCDCEQHVEGSYDNRDWLNGVLFTDKMGQQAYQIYVLTEKEMMDTIVTSFDKLKQDGVFHLGDNLPFTFWDFEEMERSKYQPVNLVERIDEYGERQIDVEMVQRTTWGEDIHYYVENLECVGFAILFNIYMVSWAV